MNRVQTGGHSSDHSHREDVIYSVTATEPAAAFRPRVRIHEQPHASPFATLAMGPLTVHVGTAAMRALRDEIDGFLASEAGRRLATHERGGLPDGWMRLGDSLLHESQWAVFRSANPGRPRPWCVADPDGVIVREDIATEALAIAAAERAMRDDLAELATTA